MSGGNVAKVVARGASDGERAKFSPREIAVGICRTSLLFGEAGGRYHRDSAMAERPVGVVNAVRTAPLIVSRLVPSDSLPTRLNPAPALVCKLIKVAASAR